MNRWRLRGSNPSRGLIGLDPQGLEPRCRLRRDRLCAPRGQLHAPAADFRHRAAGDLLDRVTIRQRGRSYTKEILSPFGGRTLASQNLLAHTTLSATWLSRGLGRLRLPRVLEPKTLHQRTAT